jgi:hypothetical protein
MLSTYAVTSPLVVYDVADTTQTFSGMSAPLFYANGTHAATTTQEYTLSSDGATFISIDNMASFERPFDFINAQDEAVAWSCFDTTQFNFICLFVRGQTISGTDGTIVASVYTADQR